MQLNMFEVSATASKQVSPFLKWCGGKSKLIKSIDKFLPLTEYMPDTYIEPFVGAGSMFIHIVKKYKHLKKVVISDNNSDLINCYKVIKNNPNELCLILDNMEILYNDLDYKNKEKNYLKTKDLFNFGDEGILYKSASFIYLNKLGFNGLCRYNKSGKFNVSWNKSKEIKLFEKSNILKFSKLLENVEIVRADYINQIKYQNAFYYLDPPYDVVSKTANFTGYTADGFNKDDQARLAKNCRNFFLLHSKFLQSNADTPLIRELYREYEINEIKAKRSINSDGKKRGEVSELLISNYI